MQPENFKVDTYIPEKFADELISALKAIPVNRIGYYSGCVSWYPVRSTWTCLEGSAPYLGTPGEASEEDEIKIEFLCAKDDLRKAVEAVRRVHPYEQPVIDIMPLYLADDVINGKI
ncbi:MAG: hypothetical protein ACI4LM_05560 [Anaerovoracaceae bacterium]